MKKLIRHITLTSIAILLSIMVSGQTLQIDSVSACAGDTILVPVTTTGFIGISAISLAIDYDATVSTFDGITNVHSQLAGIMANAISSPKDEIRIGWFAFGPVGADIGTGKLFDLVLIYHGGTQTFSFDPVTELADNNYNPVPFTLINGYMQPGLSPQISVQPEPLYACSGTNAVFSLTASDYLSVQWEINTGTGWLPLTEGFPYQGVNTGTLTVSNVDGSMHQNQFRAHLVNLCHVWSDEVPLYVSTPVVDAGMDDTLCYGGSSTLFAAVTGGYAPFGYLWSNAANTAATSVSPTSTETYHVTVTDSLGCITTDQITVVVSNPVTDAGNNDTICLGSATTLQSVTTGGIAPYTYVWQHGGNQPSSTVSPGTGTLYTIQVTDIAGCTSSDQVFVEVSNPVADAGNNDSICIQASATLNATVTGGYAPYQYEWSNQVNSSQNIVSPTSNTVYTVTITDRFLCTSTNQVEVLVSNPVTHLGDDDTLCLGQQTAYTATTTGGFAPYSYHWSTHEVTQTIQMTPTTTTTYSVTVTDAIGCLSDQQVTVYVSDPVVDAGLNDTICLGANTVATATPSGGFAPYHYHWSNSGLTSDITVSPAATTQYSVTITDAAGCVATDHMEVAVSDPSVTVGPRDTICINTSHTLNAIATGGFGGYQYLWSDASTQSSITVTPLSDTWYGVTVTDAFLCEATAGETVIVSDPQADAGADQAVCEGEQVTFNGTATNGFAPYTYSWNGIPGQQYQTTATASGQMVLLVTDQFNCTATDTAQLTAWPNPVLDPLTDDTVCYNTTANLTASATGGTGAISYLWSTTETTATITPLITQNTQYWVQATDINNCQTSDSLWVLVSNPSVTLGSDDTLCLGQTLAVAGQVTGGFGPYSYNWSTGAVTPQINITGTTDTCITLEVLDLIGCAAIDTMCIVVNLLAVDAGADVTQCPGEALTLTAVTTGGFGAITYQWSTGATVANTVAYPTTDSTFVVTVHDAFGCQAHDSLSATMHPVPMPNLGPDITMCINHVVTLDPGTGFASYLWSTGDNTQTITLDGSQMSTGTHNYSVTVTNTEGCNNSDTITVEVDPCYGIDEAKGAERFVMAPNPATHFVNLVLPVEGEVLIVIYDAKGAVVDQHRKQSADANPITLNVGHLAPGLYHIAVRSREEVMHGRLVVRR